MLLISDQQITSIPVIGWVVILITVILLFLLAWVKGINIDKIGFKTGVQKEINSYDFRKSVDEALRIELYHQTQDMDRIEHAEIRKLSKNVQRQIRILLGMKTNCEIAFHSLSTSIADIFLQRAIENNLRKKLCPSNRENYHKDMELEIQDVYNDFRMMISQANCGHNYPEYTDVEPIFKEIVEKWSSDARKIVCSTCKDKITLYEDNSDRFYSDLYKASSIIHPIEKNQQYIKDMAD